MASFIRRPWNKWFLDILNRPWAGTPRKTHWQTQRLAVERLESRIVLDGPDHYSGIFTGNHEWNDTSGTYFIDAPGLTVGIGATLSVGPGVHVQIQAGATLTDNGTATFGANASVSFGYSYGTTTQIVVNN